MTKLVELRRKYQEYLDKKARDISYNLSFNIFENPEDDKKRDTTKLILKYISELYLAAKIEKNYTANPNFEAAYHQSITSELEFLIARILFHFQNQNKLNWKISLRRQKKDIKTNKLVVPDIKIEKNNKLICVIEVKAKAGWVQPVFKKNDNSIVAEEYISKFNKQIEKYAEFGNLGKENVYVLLPTLTMVSKKRDKAKFFVKDYKREFSSNTKLPEENFILLSNNVYLDLAEENTNIQFLPSLDFDNFIKNLAKNTTGLEIK